LKRQDILDTAKNIITNDRAMRNLLEQLFIIYGAKTVIAETGQAAKAIIAQMGLTTFSLIVIDTAALEACELYTHHVACQLLQDWTAEHPDIPVLFIGTGIQKHAILALRADTVMFLVKPFQLHEVVDELLEAGREFGMGIECGSKAELIATLPQVHGDMLLICNGVKDREMLSLMLAWQQLGQNNVPVVENYSEFVQLKALIFETGFVPQMGVRVRLATRGSGRWSESGGDRSKFGLTAREIVGVVENAINRLGQDVIEVDVPGLQAAGGGRVLHYTDLLVTDYICVLDTHVSDSAISSKVSE